MAQSILQVYIHLIFSTHGREKCLHAEYRPRLWAYLAKTSEGLGYFPIQFGGHIDHVHGLVRMGKEVTPPEWIKQLKQRSNDFLKRECGFPGGFRWQAGYGAFSVGPESLDIVAKYIRNQEEHHANTSFRDEYLMLMKKYAVDVDPGYVFDD